MADIETPRWRDKTKIGHLMRRLDEHGHGKIKLSATQVQAIRLYLDKTLPSLSAVASETKHSGKLQIGWKADE